MSYPKPAVQQTILRRREGFTRSKHERRDIPSTKPAPGSAELSNSVTVLWPEPHHPKASEQAASSRPAARWWSFRALQRKLQEKLQHKILYAEDRTLPSWLTMPDQPAGSKTVSGYLEGTKPIQPSRHREAFAEWEPTLARSKDICAALCSHPYTAAHQSRGLGVASPGRRAIEVSTTSIPTIRGFTPGETIFNPFDEVQPTKRQRLIQEQEQDENLLMVQQGRTARNCVIRERSLPRPCPRPRMLSETNWQRRFEEERHRCAFHEAEVFSLRRQLCNAEAKLTEQAKIAGDQTTQIDGLLRELENVRDMLVAKLHLEQSSRSSSTNAARRNSSASLLISLPASPRLSHPQQFATLKQALAQSQQVVANLQAQLSAKDESCKALQRAYQQQLFDVQQALEKEVDRNDEARRIRSRMTGAGPGSTYTDATGFGLMSVSQEVLQVSLCANGNGQSWERRWDREPQMDLDMQIVVRRQTSELFLSA